MEDENKEGLFVFMPCLNTICISYASHSSHLYFNSIHYMCVWFSHDVLQSQTSLHLSQTPPSNCWPTWKPTNRSSFHDRKTMIRSETKVQLNHHVKADQPFKFSRSQNHGGKTHMAWTKSTLELPNRFHECGKTTKERHTWSEPTVQLQQLTDNVKASKPFRFYMKSASF